MILETIPALSALTADQKLQLVSELWQDVSRETTITAQTTALLDKCLQECAANPDAVRTTEQVTAGIQELKKHIAASRA
ncbi:addiction module protein [Prosthecobacter sp.]|uniref:addiction module protein n=1 Tax=Prosthecobacter sp. TaxID=1965333 RepID=UPI003783C489